MSLCCELVNLSQCLKVLSANEPLESKVSFETKFKNGENLIMIFVIVHTLLCNIILDS